MSGLVFDTGALIALERGARDVLVLPFENSLTLEDQVLTSRGDFDLALWRLDYCP